MHLIDDIVDSGGTLCNAAGRCKNSATEVYAYATHGVLSGKAVGASAVQTQIHGGDGLHQATPEMRTVPIYFVTSPPAGRSVRRINNEASVSVF